MKTYKQEICGNCLQYLANDEGDHSEVELTTMKETLKSWAEDGYVAAGIVTDCESSFSWRRCDLCGQIAGDRYEYNFIQK